VRFISSSTAYSLMLDDIGVVLLDVGMFNVGMLQDAAAGVPGSMPDAIPYVAVEGWGLARL
jgi:hypothetical protein